MLRILLCGLMCVVGLAVSRGENWPGWRGPRGDGTSLEQNAPTTWCGTNNQNLAWKTAVPGEGHSSPIIWGDRLFLTTALKASEERCLLCFDRLSGELLWQKTVITSPLEGKNSENSFASATPTTDGEKVYVTFLDGKDLVLAAYDFKGNQVWLARPAKFYSQHGFSHNPALFEDKIIVAAYSKADNVIIAVAKSNGSTVWKAQGENASQSYSPPLIGKMAGRLQLVVPGNGAVTSLDPRTGKPLWVVGGPSSDAVITPVYNEKAGLVLTSSSWPKRVLLAIKPDGEGDVTTNQVVWSSSLGAPYVPSPISVGDWFFTIGSDTKEAFCFQAATGEVLWREKLGAHHASPVSAGGLVYFLNDEGIMHVLKAGATCELVARNELGEKAYASPAFYEGQIFLRGFKHLYAFGPRPGQRN